MSIWLVTGLVLVAESMVLTWAWALCRAAAVEERLRSATPEDRYPAAHPVDRGLACMPATQTVRIRLIS